MGGDKDKPGFDPDEFSTEFDGGKQPVPEEKKPSNPPAPPTEAEEQPS